MPHMSRQPLTAAIVGAGHRSVLYASLAKSHPEDLRIEAVADPDDVRRRKAAQDHGVPPESQFRTAEELAAVIEDLIQASTQSGGLSPKKGNEP